MDMYQKRKMRQEKKNNNQEEKLTKVVLNWYPGHMAKTKRQIAEDLKLIDIVIEILDARIPIASQNPDINKLIQNKKRIIVLNKSDLADKNQNEKWIRYFKNKGDLAILVDSNSGKGIKECINAIRKCYEAETYVQKGRIGKSIRIMILGIPNVGKSSFINRISKKASAQVGNKPGITRQKQWIKVDDNIELMDTPGVLWPKFENEQVALNLAYTGTIKDDILQTIEIGFQLLKFLVKNYRKNIIERYKLDPDQIHKIMEQDLEENELVLAILDEIGKKRGALISGGYVDQEKTAGIILDDFRNGKLGEITLEQVHKT